LDKIDEYIKQLSLNDKKSLIEKTLKLSEEVGELAKVVLPYGGAYATNHRVVNKRKLLEEVVDIHLVNQSIMYDLGFTESDFNDLLVEKALVWNSLQVKEDRALANGDTMPYEIHITVNAEEGINIEDFKLHCIALGVKPILLDLQNQNGKSVMDDVMTSSKVFGNNGEAFDELSRISFGLREFGYNVIREKIEASYWHQKAPFKEDDDSKMPEGCYFECHFNVTCTDDKLKTLGNLATNYNCHLSKNKFKSFEDGSYTIMMTFRSYDLMYEDFENSIEWIKKQLKVYNFDVEKEVVEFSIYDTNNSHDNKWLGK